MASQLKCKNYIGDYEYDDEFAIYHGEVIANNDVITFQSKTVDGLLPEMIESIQEYHRFCEKIGKTAAHD